MATAEFDCARGPEGKTCSVRIIGERDDVIRAAHEHLVSVHGHTAGGNLENEVSQAIDEHHIKYTIWGN